MTSKTKGRVILALAACFLLGVWSWVEAGRVGTLKSSHNSALRQVERMSRDIARIELLRKGPKVAAERERPNDALLSQIRDSMKAVGIPQEHWIGNDPTAAVRVPKSSYKSLTVRLGFEELTLRQLVQLSHHLTNNDHTLSIPRFRIFAPHGQSGDTWNVELDLSYLIYSPTLGS